MKQWIKEIQFVKQMATHLLLPRKSNYHDDYLIFKLSKNNHLKHVNFKSQNEFKQVLNITVIKQKQHQNDTCIIFLHGYGSNKQEGFTLIDYLPKEMDLCCFDFSASGKSQGNLTTYGLKQFRDIRAIIKKLKEEQFGYRQFILWGRSMGAVASFLMSSSLEASDKILKKNIIFQVLDSPFSSFQSICSYQGRQSFKLPQPFISYGIQILKSHLKNHQPHLNPFHIDLIKASDQCSTNTLFVYSQQDDMIPKENSLSIIEKLPSTISYEKLLINQNHNTLRSQHTNQEIFKIISKNYFKHLYNIQKTESFKSKNDPNSLTMSEKTLSKIQSEAHFHRKNIASTIYLEKNPTEQTSNHMSLKEVMKKQKKYLELFSTQQKSKKKMTKGKPEMKHIKIDIGQIHYYRNNSSKASKIPQYIKKVDNQHIDNEDTFEHKNTINSINSFKDIHKLRRSNTFDCPEGYEPVQKITNAQSFEKTKNFDSSASTAIKPNYLEESLQINGKIKKRALYCSLKKNYGAFQITLNPHSSKNCSSAFVKGNNAQDLN